MLEILKVKGLFASCLVVWRNWQSSCLRLSVLNWFVKVDSVLTLFLWLRLWSNLLKLMINRNYLLQSCWWWQLWMHDVGLSLFMSSCLYLASFKEITQVLRSWQLNLLCYSTIKSIVIILSVSFLGKRRLNRVWHHQSCFFTACLVLIFQMFVKSVTWKLFLAEKTCNVERTFLIKSDHLRLLLHSLVDDEVSFCDFLVSLSNLVFEFVNQRRVSTWVLAAVQVDW